MTPTSATEIYKKHDDSIPLCLASTYLLSPTRSSPRQCLLSLCLWRRLSGTFHLPSGPLHHTNKKKCTSYGKPHYLKPKINMCLRYGRGQRELPLNTALPRLRVFMHPVCSRRWVLAAYSPLVLAGLWKQPFSPAERRASRTNDPLHCTGSIWPAASCTVSLSNVPMTLAKRKPL